MGSCGLITELNKYTMNYKELRQTVSELRDNKEITFKAKATLMNLINLQETKQLPIHSVVNCTTCKYQTITANNEENCRMCHNFSKHKPLL